LTSVGCFEGLPNTGELVIKSFATEACPQSASLKSPSILMEELVRKATVDLFWDLAARPDRTHNASKQIILMKISKQQLLYAWLRVINIKQYMKKATKPRAFYTGEGI
jgi:hypothetical protein